MIKSLLKKAFVGRQQTRTGDPKNPLARVDPRQSDTLTENRRAGVSVKRSAYFKPRKGQIVSEEEVTEDQLAGTNPPLKIPASPGLSGASDVFRANTGRLIDVTEKLLKTLKEREHAREPTLEKYYRLLDGALSK